MDFFGLIYNEFFILNFWNLAAETHPEIARRASTREEMNSMESIEVDIESINVDD